MSGDTKTTFLPWFHSIYCDQDCGFDRGNVKVIWTSAAQNCCIFRVFDSSCGYSRCVVL